MPTRSYSRCSDCNTISFKTYGSCRCCGSPIGEDDPAALACYRCGDYYVGKPCAACGGTRMVPKNERFDDKHAATMNPSWKGRRIEPFCANCSYKPDPHEPEPFCSVCGHDFVRSIEYD